MRKVGMILASGALLGGLAFASPASAGDKPPPPPKGGCEFPPGALVAPEHSTATPGDHALVETICTNAGRGEGSEFNRESPFVPDIDPGGSQNVNNRGGD